MKYEELPNLIKSAKSVILKSLKKSKKKANFYTASFIGATIGDAVSDWLLNNRTIETFFPSRAHYNEGLILAYGMADIGSFVFVEGDDPDAFERKCANPGTFERIVEALQIELRTECFPRVVRDLSELELRLKTQLFCLTKFQSEDESVSEVSYAVESFVAALAIRNQLLSYFD